MKLRKVAVAVAVISVLFAGRMLLAQNPANNPVVQWQALLSTINDIQAEIAVLQQQKGGINPPAGQLGGTTTAPTVLGSTFGSTQLSNGNTAPALGQCLGNNGGVIGPLTCSGGGGGGGGIGGATDNVFNVLNASYGAIGDGTHDDTANIQAAINAACASVGQQSMVYLPANTGSGCYKITSPLRLTCSGIEFVGAGWTQSSICPSGYFGPAIIAEAAETGWKAPLTANIAATWQATHAYSLWQDILDSNGNIEVQEHTGGCTSSGTVPTWPGSQAGTVTDGTCTWARVTTGTQIASGTGTSLDAADPEFFNGAGFGGNNGNLSGIMFNGGLESQMQSLSAFTLEFYVEPFVSDGGTGNYHLIDINHLPPFNTGVGLTYPVINISFGGTGTGGSCPFNCLNAEVLMNGATYVGNSGSFIVGGANSSTSINHVHHVALTYDGTTLRLFLDGNLVGSAATTLAFKVPSGSEMEIASISNANYQQFRNGSTNQLPAFYDSVRISNTARYTAAFTPPTAKFSTDANTLFLENFPTTAPTGTMQATVGSSVSDIPLLTSNGNAEINPGYISDLGLGGNGIWAAWMINSTIERIRMTQGGPSCLNLADNDFQDTIGRFFCQIVPGTDHTSVGFVFGTQGNNNKYDHLQCDGQNGCIEQLGGSGTYILPDYTDRGNVIYPFSFITAQALLISPTTDIEDVPANWKADIYSIGAYSPIQVLNGQLTAGNNTGSFLQVNGGAPIIDRGTDFIGTPGTLLNVLGGTTAVNTISNAALPGSFTRTNGGFGQYLGISQEGGTEQTNSAGLWTCATVNKGRQVIVTDVDTCAWGSSTAHTTGTTWCREGCTGTNWLAGQ